MELCMGPAATLDQDSARKALEHYASQYCEGWCKEAPAAAEFADCGGCVARRALAALSRS